MVIENRGVHGSITKEKEHYHVDVSYKGWGSMELYHILEKLNLLGKIENMKQGDSIIFKDEFVTR